MGSIESRDGKLYVKPTAFLLEVMFGYRRDAQRTNAQARRASSQYLSTYCGCHISKYDTFYGIMLILYTYLVDVFICIDVITQRLKA